MTARTRRYRVVIQSRAIRDFCAKAGIAGSVEVKGLPDDVRLFRANSAFFERGWPAVAHVVTDPTE